MPEFWAGCKDFSIKSAGSWGVRTPVIAAIEEKIVGETPEEIFKSLQNDISLFELELLLDWYEQKERACNSAVGAPK